MKTYGGVLSEVLDNENIAATQPKVITEYVQLDKDGKPMGKVEKPKEDKVSTPDDVSLSHLLSTIDQIQLSNKELLNNFVQMDNKLTGLSITSSSGKKADLSYLEDYTLKIKVLSDRVLSLETTLNQFDSKIATLERLLRSEINTLTGTINKVAADNVNQLRENEHSIEELSKNIQFLVYSEKEKQENPITELVSGLKFLIIPILILTILLIMFTFRLRHDIKSKLL